MNPCSLLNERTTSLDVIVPQLTGLKTEHGVCVCVCEVVQARCFMQKRS